MKQGACLIKTLISFVILAFIAICVAGTFYFLDNDFRDDVNSFFETANTHAEHLDKRLEKAKEKAKDAHEKHIK